MIHKSFEPKFSDQIKESTPIRNISTSLLTLMNSAPACVGSYLYGHMVLTHSGLFEIEIATLISLRSDNIVEIDPKAIATTTMMPLTTVCQ